MANEPEWMTKAREAGWWDGDDVQAALNELTKQTDHFREDNLSKAVSIGKLTRSNQVLSIQVDAYKKALENVEEKDPELVTKEETPGSNP